MPVTTLQSESQSIGLETVAARIRLLLSSIPDQTPFAEFQKQAFRPFLYWVGKTAAENTEIQASEAFASHYYLAAAQNVLKMDAAAEILLVLEARGIVAVLLKGLALVVSTYRNNPGIRPMSDIDLLISPEDWPETDRLLAGLGYAVSQQYRGSYNYFGRAGLINLDLHTRFMRYEDLFPLNRQEISGRLRLAPLDGQVQARILGSEHQLLHVALHLAPGLYAQMNLINLLDICLMAADKVNPIDWDYLQQLCGRSELSTYVLPPLALCRQRLEAPVPEPFLCSVGKRASRRQREYIESDYLERIVDLDRPGRTIFLERIFWAPSLKAKYKMLCQTRFGQGSKRKVMPS